MSIAELESIAPLLIRNGSAGLAWRVVSRDAPLANSNAGGQLRSAWMQEVGRSAAYQHDLLAVLRRTVSVGLDPVLIKGWSIARRYPGPGLRPAADIDLCLPDGQVARAQQSLTDIPAAVDFDHLEELDGLTIEALVDRSVVVELEGQSVRVPGPADELRILCLHFLKHGGWRPLWLCDIALLCEGSPECVDLALSATGRSSQYVLAALGSSRQLLSADCIVDLPPRWIGTTIRREWGSSRVVRAHGPLPPVRPIGPFIRELPGRLPNALAATAATGASMTGWPRVLVQIAAAAIGGRRHLARRNPH